MEITYKIIHPYLLEIEWPAIISRKILDEQLSWKFFLETNHADLVQEIRLGFHTLSLTFYEKVGKDNWENLFMNLNKLNTGSEILKSPRWKIPVCYEDPYAPDLSGLAEYHQLTRKEVISIHTANPYLLHFYGFLPGFMYLGGLDPQLHTPRKAHPERKIEKGAIAIGGQQTGIYPNESPGGWHVIGKSPLTFFTIGSNPPVIPQVGDEILFESITKERFREIDKMVSQGQYEWTDDQ